MYGRYVGSKGRDLLTIIVRIVTKNENDEKIFGLLTSLGLSCSRLYQRFEVSFELNDLKVPPTSVHSS